MSRGETIVVAFVALIWVLNIIPKSGRLILKPILSVFGRVDEIADFRRAQVISALIALAMITKAVL